MEKDYRWSSGPTTAGMPAAAGLTMNRHGSNRRSAWTRGLWTTNGAQDPPAAVGPTEKLHQLTNLLTNPLTSWDYRSNPF